MKHLALFKNVRKVPLHLLWYLKAEGNHGSGLVGSSTKLCMQTLREGTSAIFFLLARGGGGHPDLSFCTVLLQDYAKRFRDYVYFCYHSLFH